MEESTNIDWCEGAEQAKKVHKDLLGVGRWYECVFCKRGFNTAQALGGHMNIHRGDRSINNNNNNNKSSTSTNYYSNHKQDHDHFSDDDRQRFENPLSNDQDNWSMSLSLDCNPTMLEDLEKNRKVIIMSDDNQKEELDLELRLGYI